VILDFGLMTQITDDQKYGMIEAIAHLIHRDYSEIGNDFVNLDFIPKGVDTAPIVPALARVFEAALAGGGAKSINFQELAADLAEITFKFPFRIPPYFALVIRAISVLEGIALVGNPEFAIIDEAYPYISKRLMTDESPRLKAAFRYMVYGQSDTLDVDRIIDMLQALEKFVAVKDTGDGSAFKVDGIRGGVYVGKGGDAVGTKKVNLADTTFASSGAAPSSTSPVDAPTDVTKEALKFLFSDDGYLLRDFILEETCNMVDALSRDAARELFIRVGIRGAAVPSIFRALAPKLTEKDKRAVDSISKLLSFLIGDSPSTSSQPGGYGLSANGFSGILSNARKPENRQKLAQLLPVLREFAPNMRAFGLQIVSRLAEKSTARVLRASADAIFGTSTPTPVPSPSLASLGGKKIVKDTRDSSVGGYGYRA
jgi:aarF domain-containing kinase